MTCTASISLSRVQLESFLYAVICEDTKGMPLSALSMLARSEVDPWREAAALAGMPKATAIDRLTSLIQAQLIKLPMHLNPAMTAVRLVALLPQRSAFAIPLRGPPSDIVTATNSRSLVAFVVIMFIMLATHMFIASRLPAAQADSAATAGAVLAKMSPPNPNP